MKQLGSNLKLCFLSGNKDAVIREMLDLFQNEGISNLGLSKSLIIEGNRSISFIAEDLVQDIHNRGMELTLYTLRNEHYFLYFDYGQDPYKEMEQLFELGIDAYFTDFPSTLNNFLNWKQLEYESNSAKSIYEARYFVLLLLTLLLVQI